MDYDNLNPDDYAGCLFLDLGSCPIAMNQNNIPPPPTPTWMPFFLEKPGDSSGELLVSYQVPVVCSAYQPSVGRVQLRYVLGGSMEVPTSLQYSKMLWILISNFPW